MYRMSWTDERMDDFAANVDRRFDEVDRRFGEVDRRFDRVEEDMRTLRSEMNGRFERVEERLDDVNRTILRLGGGALVTFVVGFAGLIATQL
jgi:hypothetical protein